VWIASLLFLQRMAAALVANQASGAYAGPLEAVYLGLYTNPTPVLNYNSTLANITEATFTGYVRKELVWDSAYFGAELYEYLEAGSLHWQPTDAVAPNVVTGLFIADAVSAGNLLLSGVFPPPGIPMSSSLNALTVIARFGLNSAQNWGDFTTLE
jgi:hypothetical protein